jgi:hypothetical protein
MLTTSEETQQLASTIIKQFKPVQTFYVNPLVYLMTADSRGPVTGVMRSSGTE